MKKQLIIVALALADTLSANAQYTFQSITVAGSGPTSKATTIITWGPYVTREMCEQKRRDVEIANSWSEPILGGRIESKTRTTPCSGPGGSTGSVDVLGISKGSSFYSTNPVDEIKDWANDDLERILALNTNFAHSSATDLSMGSPDADRARSLSREYAFVLDTSKPFRSLNIDEKGEITTSSSDLDMFEPVWQMEKKSRNLQDSDVFVYRNRMQNEATGLLDDILSSLALSCQELESYIQDWRQILNFSYFSAHSEYEKARDIVEKSYQLAQFKIEYMTIQANKYIQEHPNEQGSTQADVGFALSRLTPWVKAYEEKYKDYDDDQFLANREKELIEKYNLSQEDIQAIKMEVDNESLTGHFTTLTAAVPNVGIGNNNDQQKKTGDKSEQTLAVKSILDKLTEGVSLAVVATDLANLYSYNIERDAIEKLLMEQDANIERYDDFFNEQSNKLNDLSHLISVSSVHHNFSEQRKAPNEALKWAIGVDNTLSRIRKNASGNNYNELLPDLVGRPQINREYGNIRIHL